MDKNNIDGWTITKSGGYYRLFKKIDGRNRGIYLGKYLDFEVAREKIQAYELCYQKPYEIKIESHIWEQFKLSGGSIDIIIKFIDDYINEFNEEANLEVDQEANLEIDAKSLRAIYESLGGKIGKGFIRIDRIRRALNWDRARFNACIDYLRLGNSRRGPVIELHGGNPSKMKKDEINDCFYDDHTKFHFISLTFWS